jgi:TonB family protein
LIAHWPSWRSITLGSALAVTACGFYTPPPVSPGHTSLMTASNGGTLTIHRFAGTRVRVAVLGMNGANVDIAGDSTAWAALADVAESGDSAALSDRALRSTLVLRRNDNGYNLSARRDTVSVELNFSVTRASSLLRALRGLPIEYAAPPLGLDRGAFALPGNPSPPYPRALLKAKKEGAVTLNFIVDTTGFVVPASVQVVQSTDTAFTASVLATMPRFRYSPAMAGGKKVQELVHTTIAFTLNR